MTTHYLLFLVTLPGSSSADNSDANRVEDADGARLVVDTARNEADDCDMTKGTGNKKAKLNNVTGHG